MLVRSLRAPWGHLGSHRNSDLGSLGCGLATSILEALPRGDSDVQPWLQTTSSKGIASIWMRKQTARLGDLLKVRAGPKPSRPLEKGPSGCSPSPQPCALHPAATRGPRWTGEVEESQRGGEQKPAGKVWGSACPTPPSSPGLRLLRHTLGGSTVPRPPRREPVACVGLARAEGRAALGTPVWGGHGSAAVGAAPCCRWEALSFLRGLFWWMKL